jgi:GSH-dependent disulfide-bond oxidoreductase
MELVYLPNPTAQALIILLKEAGLEYHPVSPQNESAGPSLAYPLLVDDGPVEGSGPIEIYHPGAAMAYLAQKAGHAESYDAVRWVMWQTARQAFPRHKISHSSEDHSSESSVRANRLFNMLNFRLSGRSYIAGDSYSIADMMCYPWARSWLGDATRVEGCSDLNRWLARLEDRGAVRDGMEAGRRSASQSRSLDEALWRAMQYSSLPGDPTTNYP